ncbi:hypothetical protein HC928_23095, partial [bacterium]|nr:hypothetical protein [bacterium]
FPWSETPSLQTYLRGVTILNQTPEENLATWLFVKFWATNVEAQVAWTAGANYQPFYTPAREGLSEEFRAERPQFTNVFDIFGAENVVKYAVPSHPRSNEIHTITGDLFINAITTDEDIAALAQEATDAANEVYASVLEEIAEAAGN